jgi:hypothetical protein
MRYRVVFRERTDAKANPTEHPAEFLDNELDDGVVLDAAVVEREQPPALHSQPEMDEDDSFLSIETETWDYDVADDRTEEFEDALRNSGMVVEFEVLGDEDIITTD